MKAVSCPAGPASTEIPPAFQWLHRGRETLKEKLKPYLQTGEWSE
jgi:hypothetical protein